MELVETKEAGICNAILNHPDVKPYVKGLAEGDLDVTPALSSDGTILYAAPDAVFLFTDHGQGRWEASIASLPVARGERFRTLFHEAIDRMFDRPEVETLVVPAPEAHVRLRRVLDDVGFKEAGKTGTTFPFLGKPTPVHLYILPNPKSESH